VEKLEEIDKTVFKDEKGRYLTQSLFLEIGYDTEHAVFTLDGEDKLYKGKTYHSLKRRYLELSDPIEYTFASTYLADWKHWQRISGNKVLLEHIKEWREELLLSLRSEGVLTLIDLAKNQASYQAGKWLVDTGWDVKEKGRPTKANIKQQLKRETDLEKSFEADFKLLNMKKDK
jgi:hypothetical protein